MPEDAHTTYITVSFVDGTDMVLEATSVKSGNNMAFFLNKDGEEVARYRNDQIRGWKFEKDPK